MSGTTVINYGNDIYAFDQGMVRAFLICGKERALLFDTGVEKTCLTEGIQRGELSGTATPMKDQEGRRVLEYREGSSGIYHI